MIDGLKPYPAMEDSGLRWLGPIPDTWRVLRGKNVFRVIDVRSETGSEELLTVSSGDGVVPRSQKTVTMFKAESYVGHKLCWPGDLVINSLWAWMQGLGFSRHYGLVSSAYSVYRPRPTYKEYADYFHYSLRSAAYKWELQTRSKGVWLSRLQLSDPAFLDMPIVVPPPGDQSAIVCFLNYADRRIRRYIRTKQKLIKLLEEQKQAIIHRAVTRGLNPDVRLKPSGVEWLGAVPEHWEMVRLKNVSPQITVGIVIQPAQLYVTSGVPCLRSLNISSGRISTADLVFISSQSHKTNSKSRLQKGDVVVVRTGRTGVAVVVDEAFDGANCIDLLIVRKSRRLLSEYLLTYLHSSDAKSDIAFNSVGAIQAHYNTATLANLRIPLPPLIEQTALLKYLATEVAPLDEIIVRTAGEIGLIREYRARLIADAVTGKLDVRAAAASLPEEADKTEEADAVLMSEDMAVDGDEAPDITESEVTA